MINNGYDVYDIYDVYDVYDVYDEPWPTRRLECNASTFYSEF